MAIEAIGLDQIHDNPYQARLTYHKKDIDELAHSIQTHGLLQVPPGRRKDGNIELAFGHLRKRAFDKLAKKDPVGFGMMPIDIKCLSDDQMAMFALEENLKRRGISPLETARAVDKYLVSFPGKTEVELAESLNMAKGTVSNMRRVLRLPEKILEKIDEGIISFHQGRELLIFERFENAENLMGSALYGLKTGNKHYGEPNTVEGLQKSIDSVISGQYRPLDKDWEGYRWDILFDTRAAGCLECDKMVRTHPTKSATVHYCTDSECWDRHQEEHREKASAAAKAKMEAEVLERVSQDITQRTPEPAVAYNMEKRGTSWIATDDQGRIIAIGHDKEVAEEIAKDSFEPVATAVNPDTYLLNHTYRISRKLNRRKPDDIFDVTAQDLPTAITALGVKTEDIEGVKVYKSSGKLGTGGGVSAGWSKCTEPLEAVQEQLEEKPDEGDFSQEKVPDQKRKRIPVAVDEGGAALPVPCHSCAKSESCDLSFFHIADDGGQLVCERWECDHLSWAEKDIHRRIAEAPAPPPQDIPEDILALAREKAGTRAEVLDLNDICSGESYYRQVKQGYADLSAELRHIDDPAECLERCTHGFHYAFDSKARDPQRVLNVCSDTKCLAKKKGAFTRKVNADGQARKKTETKAIKEAIAQTTTLDRPRIKLILLAQMDGQHCTTYYYAGAKKPETWLWEKISAGTAAIARKREDLFKRIDKLPDEVLSQLVVEFMLYYLADHGDIGSYEIKTELPLSWLGMEVANV